MTEKRIEVFQPLIGEEETQAVVSVLRSKWLGRGHQTEEFEREFASHIGSVQSHVRSTTCCTEALFQAIGLCAVGPGDEVVLPSISFVGAANAIMATGARPVFCDVDPRSLNACANHIAPMITPRTRAVIILHYGGVPAEMGPILALASENRISVVEDSACAPASSYRGVPCGTMGDFGTWSFDSMKIAVAGDGGMLYCKEPYLAARAEKMFYLGMGYASGSASSSKGKSRWWEFSVDRPGRRAVMNDILSSIGRVQLRKLPAFVRRRCEIKEAYDARLSRLTWLELPPPIEPDAVSSYYLYWIFTPPGVRDRLASRLLSKGVYTTFRYSPLHVLPIYAWLGHLPNAESASERTLCIPSHHGMADKDVDRVASEIERFGAEEGL